MSVTTAMGRDGRATCPMLTIVSVSQATASDNGPAQCSASWAHEICRAVVRAARRPDRYPLWEALSSRRLLRCQLAS